MTDLYNIVMEGKAIAGWDNQEVQQNLAKIFKEPPEKMGRLLSGKKLIVKKSVGHEKAVNIIRMIEKAGAECKIVKQKTILSKPLDVAGNDTTNSKVGAGSSFVSNKLPGKASKSQQSSIMNPYKTPKASLAIKQKKNSEQKNKRPTSITVISWLLIVGGGISLTSNTLTLNNPMVQDLMSKNPMPISMQYTMLYVGLLITIVCGIAMLKRQNWARLLYVGWGIFGSLVGVATSPMKLMMIPGIIGFLIFVFFLFRPKANKYFKGLVAS